MQSLRLFPSVNSWDFHTPEDIVARGLHPLSLLEMHAAHACNLTCESCSHFSNQGHKGWIEVEEADEWMSAWTQRLWPKMFRLLGGEPTLNPRLPELMLLAKKHWPRSRIAITTNGFFAHRHPDLGRVLGEVQARVLVTLHDSTQEYQEKARPGLELLSQWKKQFGFDLLTENSHPRWTRRYFGNNENVLPFEDGDLKRSWENCPARFCRQLFRGKLWKCSPIAYLQVQKKTHPAMSEKWDPYLAYRALPPSCSDEELVRFLATNEEAACGMCPAEPKKFSKASPLIPLSVIRKQNTAAV